jgi:cytochrome P450
VRLESPIRGFSRVAAEDCEIDGVKIQADSRVLVLYASANRDERKWSDPEKFDIQRHDAREQLGFGIGRHVCAGQHLARLEIQCLLRAMTERIASFEVGEAIPQLNNTLRGLAGLPVKVKGC